MPAFTEAQRTSIRRYLGWSARFAQVDTALELALNAIENDTGAYDLVIVLLGKLDGVSTKLDGVYTRLKATQVGTLKLDGATEVAVIRSEGRRFAGQMASIFGVPIRHDAFGAFGPKTTQGWGGYYPHG